MGHPLIHGVNPKLKRLRVPPFGCRLGIPLVSRVAPSLPYRADHIPLPGRVRRRRHYASGQTMGVLFTTLCVSFYARLHTSSVGMFVFVLFHNLHPPSSALYIFFLGTILRIIRHTFYNKKRRIFFPCKVYVESYALSNISTPFLCPSPKYSSFQLTTAGQTKR